MLRSLGALGVPEVCGFDGRFDGFENLLIAGAPAQIARQRGFDLIACRPWVLVQQRLGGDQESGRAVSALGGAQISERFLQRVQAAVAGKAFDRRDRTAVAVDAEHEAREHRLAVEQHGAGAAFAQLAAVLGAAQVQVFTQNLEQRLVRRERDLGRFAVQRDRDGGVVHDECL